MKSRLLCFLLIGLTLGVAAEPYLATAAGVSLSETYHEQPHKVGPFVAASFGYELARRWRGEIDVSYRTHSGNARFLKESETDATEVVIRGAKSNIYAGMVNAGLNLVRRCYFTPYALAGVGAVVIKEESNDGELVNRRTTAAFQGILGFEIPVGCELEIGLQGRVIKPIDTPLSGMVAVTLRLHH